MSHRHRALALPVVVVSVLALLSCTSSQPPIPPPLPSAEARQQAPPVPYEDRGACPFEGCVYREWIARRATPIYRDRNAGSPILARLEPGDKVDAVTGVVVTSKAGTVRFTGAWTGEGTHSEGGVVVHDRLEAKPGDVMYLLTYQGEGFSKVWFQGRLVENVDTNAFSEFRCQSQPNACPGQMTPPTRVWWVQMKTSNGTEGWTNRAEDFGNNDLHG